MYHVRVPCFHACQWHKLSLSLPALQPHRRPSRPVKQRPSYFGATPRRTFVSIPFKSTAQTLTASRILPYPSQAIYKIIADIPQYSSFIPYCQNSTVTRWSKPDKEGKVWPEEAQLCIGWGNMQNTLSSRVYCLPGRTAEAVSGRAEPTLSASDVPHHSHSRTMADGRDGNDTSLMTHCLARWTLRPFPFKPPDIVTTIDEKSTSPIKSTTQGPPREQTEVNLAIDFQFANPVFNTMSAAALPQVAGAIIKAFEKRVVTLLEGPGLGGKGEEATSRVLS